MVGQHAVTATHAGNYVNYGVREFAMAAIANGLALHGGFIPYVGTFLTFSDYMRNAVRMAALMKARSIFVFTHDSIGLGEDGPTHQSIEHAASLRLVPQLDVWRPCDTVETAVAWGEALGARGAERIAASPARTCPSYRATRRCAPASRAAATSWPTSVRVPQRAVVIATGSEVQLALGARERLAAEDIGVRVVSMPCTERFDRQDTAWRQAVLPPGIPRLAVEAGATDGWRKYVGAVDDPHAGVVGIDRYGESAPAAVLFPYFGFTVDNVCDAIRRVARPGGTMR